MAGIGFSLKRLFRKKGILALCRAYGYAGMICTGPMVLGILLLAGIAVLCRVAGVGAHDRELMNSMLTYSLLLALTVTSWLNLPVTRFISDMLYEEKEERIMPSFHGSCAILLVAGTVLYGIFLHFSGVELIYRLLCMWFAQELIVVWNEMNYLTALKDYRALVTAFGVSLFFGFFLALVLMMLRLANMATLFLCVIAAYGVLMVWYYKKLLNYFPRNEGSSFFFLRWLDRYRSLLFTGGFINLGLFAHLVIMYFGPLRVRVEGLFYGAPLHDVPALAAFLSILITTINFVTSVEVRFYPKYRNYYGLFNEDGAIRDIEQAEEEMLSVLSREMMVNACKQVVSTVIFVVFGSVLMGYLPLGMNDTSTAIFRILCAGYGFYAVGNSVMLILLYFEDYAGALAGTAVFACVSIFLTILQNLKGNINYFGLGFLTGALAFYIVVWLRLEWHTKRLPYFLLGRQELVRNQETGVFAALCDRLESRERRKKEKAEKKTDDRIKRHRKKQTEDKG